MANKVIPYGTQDISQEDINAVVDVLKSKNLTQGPLIKEFENKFAAYVNAKYAIAVSSGTAALHLCAIALNIKPGDKVITTPLTFSASANCIRYCGGEVHFIDINSDNFLIDTNKLERLLESSPKGTFKGIIPVNFAGRSNNFKEINRIIKKHNMWIIEDACHSPGAYIKYNNDETIFSGDGNYKNLSIFSFHPVKHIACGEGGMITTNDKNLYLRILNLRSHGIQQDKSLNIENHGPWYYEMQELGYNYRITDIQSALGISQLSRAKNNLKKRFEIVKFYEDKLSSLTQIKKLPGFIDGHAYHLYVILVKNRDGLIKYLRENNVFAQVHYIPVHLMPYYKKFGWKNGDFPIVEDYYNYCLSLPIYPSLERKDLNRVVDLIYKFYKY